MDNFLQTGLQAVKRAETVIVNYFSDEIRYTLKPDESPVTRADKESEEVIIKTIREQFPDHGFLGEESQKDGKEYEYLWIIDPIDGTKNYLRKLPFFATQLALMKNGELILGISNAPILQELLYAEKGKGAYCNGKDVKTSTIKSLPESYLLYGSLKRFEKKGKLSQLLSLGNTVQGFRGFGDFYNYHLLAQGLVDIVIETDCKIWDVAALSVIIQEAGGVFTDMEGNALTEHSRSALATNGYLHKDILRYFN
ncbi:inositol monophosphatase [Candidatus Roizmanbacteria bacterium]|nr:inositol monophosphatase [Candidatus Roizmanbacteria bacterium]